MKRLLFLSLLGAASLRADWKDLKEGMDQREVLAAIGAPLISTRARRGLLETWMYDHGGCVYFARGRVQFWQAPKARPAAPAAG